MRKVTDASTTVVGMVSRLQAGRPEDIRPSDGMIQWEKFARFGDMLGVISECQTRGPPAPGHVSEHFNKFFNTLPVITDEDVSFPLFSSPDRDPARSSADGRIYGTEVSIWNLSRDKRTPACSSAWAKWPFISPKRDEGQATIYKR